MTSSVFSRIYQQNAWNGVETRSGPGSSPRSTARTAAALLQLVEWLGVRSVLDVGCGEGLWQPELPGYVGLDVAPEAVEAARRNHPEREYRVRPPAEPLPAAELVLCRDVIQHLSTSAGRNLLAQIRASAQWLLASTYVGSRNTRIATGGFYSPNLEAAPFDLPPALLLIHDGYDYGEGTSLRDPAKMLGLWRL